MKKLIAAAVLSLSASGAFAAYSTGVSFFINADTNTCGASFVDVDGNFVHTSDPAPKISIVANKNVVNATCKFTDVSGVSANRGESITQAPCTVTRDYSSVVGVGHGTSGNNDVAGPGAGNVSIKCQAKP